jgi:hypothetical protein
MTLRLSKRTTLAVGLTLTAAAGLAAVLGGGCKPRSLSQVSGDESTAEPGPEMKALLEGEAYYQAALSTLRPAMRASPEDRSALSHFEKLQAIVDTWWAKSSDDDQQAATTGAEIARHVASRMIRLRHEMGFADAEQFATETLRTYFTGCREYLGCTQMLAEIADFVQILPGPVFQHLTSSAQPASQMGIDQLTPDQLRQWNVSPQVLQQFFSPPEEADLDRVVRHYLKGLMVTAIFYDVLQLENPGLQGRNLLGLANGADTAAALDVLVSTVLDDTKATWLVPTDPRDKNRNFHDEFKKVFSRYFAEAGATTDGGATGTAGATETASGTGTTGTGTTGTGTTGTGTAGAGSTTSGGAALASSELEEFLILRAQQVVNALVKNTQGLMSLKLYAQRLLAPSTRAWIDAMRDVDTDTALLTYARFGRYEAHMPGRALWVEGMLRHAQAAPKVRALDDVGNVRDVPDPKYRTWVGIVDDAAGRTDLHLQAMIKDNLKILDVPAAEMRYPNCSRRQPGPRYGLPSEELHSLIRCEEYLAARGLGFHSLDWMITRIENAIDMYVKSQVKMKEEIDAEMRRPAMSRWASAIADEFNPNTKPTQIQLETSMMEFYVQLVSLNCYRLPLLKTLPPTVEMKLEGEDKPIDILAACLKDQNDRNALQNDNAMLPNFERNVSNYMTQRKIDKIWKDFYIQAAILVSSAIIPVPIGMAAGAIVRGTVTALKVMRVVAFAARLGLPRFTYAAMRCVYEMTLFSIIHKTSNVLLLWAMGAESAQVRSAAWDSSRSFWDNLGESIAMGVAIVYFQPAVASIGNKTMGRVFGFRNSAQFTMLANNSLKNVARKLGFTAGAALIENAAFPIPTMALKFAEDVYHGRMQELTLSEAAQGFALDYVHAVPVTLFFRAAHGAGGHWARGKFYSDLRSDLYRMMSETKARKVFGFAADRARRGGIMTETLKREVERRAELFNERAKELDQRLQEYFMLHPEFMHRYPREADRLAAVRRHIDALQTGKSIEPWMEEFEGDYFRAVSGLPGTGTGDATGFEGL